MNYLKNKEHRNCKNCNKLFTHPYIDNNYYHENTFKKCDFNRHYCFKCWANIKNNNIKLELIYNLNENTDNIYLYQAKKNIENLPVYYKCNTLINYINTDNMDLNNPYLYQRYDNYTGYKHDFKIQDMYEVKSINTYNDILNCFEDIYSNKIYKNLKQKIRELTHCKIKKGLYYLTETHNVCAFQNSIDNNYYLLDINF